MRSLKSLYGLTGIGLSGLFLLLIYTFVSAPAFAQQGNMVIPKITIGVEQAKNTEDVALSLQILAILTVLSLAPAILVLSTCFTRIIIVLSFTRRALGTQQIPSNQILIGLALFLTFYAMGPTLDQINSNALQPYLESKMDTRTALEKGASYLRTFMFKHTREKDISLFVKLSGEKNKPEKKADVSLKALLPAYVISEMKTAFQMGIMIFIPFLVVDMIVASTLMSMGMIMLPPIMISLPFKLLLFVMVDGWELIIQSLMISLR